MHLFRQIGAQIRARLSMPALKAQAAQIWPIATLSLVLAFGGLAVVLLVGLLTQSPIHKLTRDPAEVLGFEPYIGMLSNWNIILWTMAAAICLFSARLLHQRRPAGDAFRFLLVSGAFSLLLDIDDLFMLHDYVLPHLLNLPEDVFYALYFVIILAYLLAFLPKILEHDFLLLTAAVLVFALSRRAFLPFSFLDNFITVGDMLKYLGIVFWLAFFYRAAAREIGRLITY